jgi:predicted nuclease of predicted toxin-antitoxin system
VKFSCRYAAAAGLGARPKHNAVHADAVGLGRSTDREILTRARREARTVVTADLDYPRLLALTGAEGPSLIPFRGGDWSEPDVTARIQQILHVMGVGEITRNIVVADTYSGASPPLTDNLRAARQRCPRTLRRQFLPRRL